MTVEYLEESFTIEDTSDAGTVSYGGNVMIQVSGEKMVAGITK